MHILFVGQDSIITETTYEMLLSAEDWQVTLKSFWQDLKQRIVNKSKEKSPFDLLIANLADFSAPPVKIIKSLISQFSTLPLLVLNTYQNRFFIDPLLESGALGYVQIGVSEDKLFTAVNNVIKGKQCVITENTY